MTIGISAILPVMLCVTVAYLEKQIETERKAVEERLNSYEETYEY